MPGISFLFKKRFHPSRLDQQKRVFIAEEKTKQHAESERELALQVAKERELQGYEGLGKAPEQDPRHASLKFMYNAPATAKGKEKIDLLAKAAPVPLDENGDDEHVRAFRAKFTSNSKSNDQSSSSNNAVVEYLVPLPPGSKGFEGDGADDLEDPPAVDAPTPHYHQTALEQAIGRKKQAIVTIDEQVTRHPRLKNAPVEGNLQGNKDALAVRHKPFNDVIRNVRCLRCGNWGHRSGDRECPLRDHNPLDFERQQREDPMARHNRNASSSSSYESQPYASYHQDRDNRGHRDSKYGPRGSMSSSSDSRQREDEIDSGYLSSDPETAFLQTLTRREKRLLLRKLQSLEGHKDAVSELKTTDVTRSEEKHSKTMPMDNKDKKPEKRSNESRSSSNDDKRRGAKRSRADREDEEGNDRMHKSNKKRRRGSHHKKRRYSSSSSSESSSSSSSDSSDDDSSSSSSSSSSASSR